MSNIQIALPGKNEWKTVEVICRDNQGVYVGAAGRMGTEGTIVLVRYTAGGQEIRRVARQGLLFGRFDYIDVPKPLSQAAPVAKKADRKFAA